MSGQGPGDWTGLIELVRRLMVGDFPDEREEDEAIAAFASRVPHPRATDLIYHWQAEFDHEPTPGEIVERAIRYRPIEQ